MLSEHGCDSVHLCDLIDEFFQVLNVGIGCVLRINFRRVQNNNLNSIRSQRLQCARYTTRLIKCLASTNDKRSLLTDLYCDTESDTPIDFLLYTPEEWEHSVADSQSFAHKLNREGVVLYG